MKQLLLIIYFISAGLLAQNSAFDPENSKGQLFQYADFTNVGKNDYSLNQLLEN